MPDEQDQESQSENVQPSAPADDIPSEPPAAVIEAAPPEHVRIGGSPGVRVTQTGLTQHKRVTGIDPGAAGADHRPVPTAVLEQVRELLYIEQPLSAADALRAVRDLLEPWLL